IEKTDQALYAAKNSGRNATRVWEESYGSKISTTNKLSGIFVGSENQDYKNVSTLIEFIDLINSEGNVDEKSQGEMDAAMLKDIYNEGYAGGLVFTWQDEWFKRTWNTMHGIDLLKTPYWSDYQTNEQYFGLLAFDPGKKESVCYVDGDRSEWKPEDMIADNGDTRLSMKYDEK
ncbi:MAG: hypothetical protein RR361_09290, partial [Anaerovorax sp.]